MRIFIVIFFFFNYFVNDCKGQLFNQNSKISKIYEKGEINVDSIKKYFGKYSIEIVDTVVNLSGYDGKPLNKKTKLFSKHLKLDNYNICFISEWYNVKKTLKKDKLLKIHQILIYSDLNLEGDLVDNIRINKTEKHEILEIFKTQNLSIKEKQVIVNKTYIFYFNDSDILTLVRIFPNESGYWKW